VRHRGRLERGGGFPPHPERYEAAGVDLLRSLGSPDAAPLLREA
jgi:hypothetical protein